jgi:putative transcriptional regulator
MAIEITLDDVLHARRMTLTQLAGEVNITIANMSILKTGKARGIRFETLNGICAALACQPGDILRFVPDEADDEETVPMRAQGSGQ